MSNSTDLSLALVGAGGGTRRRAAAPAPVAKKRETAARVAPEPAEEKLVSLSIQCAAPVRNQMKALAAERGITLQQLFFEGFNDLFAKYGKPEIAPRSAKA